MNTAHHQLVASLQRRIDQVLTPLLPETGPVALLDFPAYANVGDSAIWLGTQRFLDAAGRGRPHAIADVETAADHNLLRQIGDRPILLGGGGNFGDLWPRHQEFRERIIAMFPNNRIIQLPQTICFTNPDNLARAKQVIDRHDTLTLLVRDRRSLALARTTFQVDVQLCPDLACYLGPLPRPGTPTRPVTALVRRDKESAGETQSPVGVDWTREPAGGPVWLYHRVWRRLGFRTPPAAALSPLWSHLTTAVATARVDHGVRLLARGRTVVTDRLHGHLLSLLLGIPHFVCADRYGKVREFIETWTGESPLVTWCDGLDEAMHRAATPATVNAG